MAAAVARVERVRAEIGAVSDQHQKWAERRLRADSDVMRETMPRAFQNLVETMALKEQFHRAHPPVGGGFHAYEG